MQKIIATQQGFQSRDRRAVRYEGFSLIEVLVAIAILSVGILAILILFPAGISTLQTAAEFTDATRLGQAELERADASQTQLIAGIYPDDLMTANVNPTTYLTSTPQTIGQGTDVDAYRAIQGETVRVPAPVLDSNNNPVSLYTVVAGPIVATTGQANSLQIYGPQWQGFSADLSGSLADSNLESSSDLVAGQPQYLIDYNAGEILLAPENTSPFYPATIEFTVTGSDGKVVTQSLTLTSTQVGNSNQAGQPLMLSAIQLANAAAGVMGKEPPTPWVVGSDSLSRNFVQVNVGNAYSYNSFDGDPYEWQYYLPNLATTADPANIGVIAFNPLGAQLDGVNGQPLEAKLNYFTYDWHIISEDRTVTSLYSSVKLSLTSLLSSSASDKLSDNSTAFTGLFTYSSAPKGIANPDFIILDTDKGVVLTEGKTKDYTVSYPNGTVTFVNPSGTYVNDHLRLYYHPAKDWAVSLARAPMIYTSEITATTTPQLAHYSVSASGTPMYIYFPVADVGKQVDVRLTYTAANSTTPTVLEDLYTIASIGQDAGITLPPAITSGSTVTPIFVKGVSFSAIVIWKENGIWRNQTITTIVPNQSMPASTTLQ